jgi:tRNA1Val (adenine37-N6)-methyltransferase
MIKNPNKILDIGTGTGILSLMMAQRTHSSKITAVEIDENAYLQAVENKSVSKWSHRICVKNLAIQEISNNQKYEFIISNPPYFNNSLKTNSESKNMARHTDSLSYEELVCAVNSLLTDDGCFAVVVPFLEYQHFKLVLKANNLYIQRELYVSSRKNSKTIRVCAQIVKKPCVIKQEEIFIYELAGNQYSNSYKKLTNKFYL